MENEGLWGQDHPSPDIRTKLRDAWFVRVSRSGARGGAYV